MKIDHIALWVGDLEAVTAFFEKYFGGKRNTRYHNPRTGLSTYFISYGGEARLELMNRPDMPGGVKNWGHVSMSVGSKEAVDELTATLKADGYPVLSGPRTTGDGYYESSIEGPEAITIEITV